MRPGFFYVPHLEITCPTGSQRKPSLDSASSRWRDCAPLVAARELGYFDQEGLDVSLARQASWASIRDRVALGSLDGAQMLASLPLASTLGLGNPRSQW
jgi:ABC-type nitrate/sulfonate/bicarbonate transport system substrate-binding protein